MRVWRFRLIAPFSVVYTNSHYSVRRHRSAPSWSRNSKNKNKKSNWSRFPNKQHNRNNHNSEDSLDELIRAKSEIILEETERSHPTHLGAVDVNGLFDIKPLTMPPRRETESVRQEEEKRELKSYTAYSEDVRSAATRAYLKESNKNNNKGETSDTKEKAVAGELEDGEKVNVKKEHFQTNKVMKNVLSHFDSNPIDSGVSHTGTEDRIDEKREKRRRIAEKGRRRREKLKGKLSLSYGLSQHPCALQGGCAHRHDDTCPHLATPATSCLEMLEDNEQSLHNGGESCFLNSLGLCPWQHHSVYARNSHSVPHYDGDTNAEESHKDDYNVQALFFESFHNTNNSNNNDGMSNHENEQEDGRHTSLQRDINHTAPLIREMIDVFISFIASVLEENEKEKLKFLETVKNGKIVDGLKILQTILHENNNNNNLLSISEVPSKTNKTGTNYFLSLRWDFLERTVVTDFQNNNTNNNNEMEEPEEDFSEDALYEREIQSQHNSHHNSSNNNGNDISEEDRFAVKINISTFWSSYFHFREAEDDCLCSISYLLTPFIIQESAKLLENNNNNDNETSDRLKNASLYLFHQRQNNVDKMLTLYENELKNINHHTNKGLYLMRWAPLSFLKDLLLWRAVSNGDGNLLETMLTTILESAIPNDENKNKNQHIRHSTQFGWNYLNAILFQLTKGLLTMENLISSPNFLRHLTHHKSTFDPIRANQHYLYLFSLCQTHLNDFCHFFGHYFQNHYYTAVLEEQNWYPWTPEIMFQHHNNEMEHYYTSYNYARHHFPLFYANFVNYALNGIFLLTTTAAAAHVGELPSQRQTVSVVEGLLLDQREEHTLTDIIGHTTRDNEIAVKEKYLQRLIRQQMRRRHKTMEKELNPFTKVNLYFFGAIENFSLMIKRQHEALKSEFYALKREFDVETEKEKVYQNNFRTRKYNPNRQNANSEDNEMENSNNAELLLHPLDRLIPHNTVALSPAAVSLFLGLLLETDAYAYKSLKLTSTIVQVMRLSRHVSKKSIPKVIRSEKYVHKRVFSKKLGKKVLTKVKVPCLRIEKDNMKDNDDRDNNMKMESIPYIFCLDENLVSTMLKIALRMGKTGKTLLDGLCSDLFSGGIVDFYNPNLQSNNLTDVKAFLFPASVDEINRYFNVLQHKETDGVKNAVIEHCFKLNGMTDHSKNKNHHHNENAEQYKYAVRIAPTNEMMEVLLSHIATNDEDEKQLVLYHQTAARDKEQFIYSVHKTTNNNNQNDVCVYSFSSYVFLRQYYNFLLEQATPMAQNGIKALLISIYYCFTHLDTLALEESVSREITSIVKEVQNTAAKQYSVDAAEMKEHVTTLAHKIINNKNKKDSEINMENVKSLLKEEPHKTEQTVDRYRKEEYEKLVERLTFNRHESFTVDTLTKVHRPHKNSPSHNILLLSFVLELCLASLSGLTSETADLQYPSSNNNGIKQIFHYALLVATLLDEINLHNNNNNNLCVNGVVKSILLSPLNNNSNNNKVSNIFSSFEFSQIFTLKPFLQCQFMLFAELNNNNNNNNFSALMKLLWTDVEKNQLSTLFRTTKHDNALWSLYEGISTNSDNRLLQHYLKTSFLTPSLSLLLWIAGRVHYKQDERFNVKLMVAWLDGMLEWNANHNNNNNNDRCYGEDVTALRNVLRQRL